ncbi:MAG: lysostaphin resistance A-like protein [Actinomycetes bacterium]
MTVNPAWPPPVAPTDPTRRVRWGLGDVVWVWFAAIAVSIAAAGVAAAFAAEPDRPTGWNILVGTVAQNGAVVLALAAVARVKGVGSLRADFGLRIRLRDWWWGLVGVAISVGTGALLIPIQHLLDDSPSQEVVRIIDRSSGAAALAGALAVAIAAPIGEELLFRGALLRSLQRRVRPGAAIAITSVVFAAVHPLLDPSAVLAVVPLLVLSVVCGIVAVRGGDLSRSIWLHVGFNTITAIWLITS